VTETASYEFVGGQYQPTFKPQDQQCGSIIHPSWSLPPMMAVKVPPVVRTVRELLNDEQSAAMKAKAIALGKLTDAEAECDAQRGEINRLNDYLNDLEKALAVLA